MQGRVRRHIPDHNFSDVSRCGKGIYEMQNSILRNSVMAETAKRKERFFRW